MATCLWKHDIADVSKKRVEEGTFAKVGIYLDYSPAATFRRHESLVNRDRSLVDVTMVGFRMMTASSMTIMSENFARIRVIFSQHPLLR